MATAPAPFPGDSDPSLSEAGRRAGQSTVSALLAEQRAGDRLATVLDLKSRGADPLYVAKMQTIARHLFAEAAAATEQPVWGW